jgi:hypothetical protein
VSIYVALLGLTAHPVKARGVPAPVTPPVQEGRGALGRAARSGVLRPLAHLPLSSSTKGRGAGKVALACSARLRSLRATRSAPGLLQPCAGHGRRLHNAAQGKGASSEERIHSATSGWGGSPKGVGGRIHQEGRAPLHKKGARRCRRAPRPSSWWCRSKLSVLNHRPRAPWRPRERRSRPRAGCVRARRRPCRCRAAWWRPRTES